MSIPMLKKFMILGLYTSLTLPEFADNKLLLVTAVGTIIGEPMPEDLPFPECAFPHLCDSLHDSYCEEFQGDSDNLSNDGYIVLKNAKILSASGALSPTTNLGDLIVFFDQIIAAKIGNFDTAK